MFKGSDPAVTAVTPGSQAELLGVKVGWKITHIAGKKAPAAAKDILAALSTARKGSAKYKVQFDAPPGDVPAAAPATASAGGLSEVVIEAAPDAKDKLGCMFKGSDPAVVSVTAGSQAETLGIKKSLTGLGIILCFNSRLFFLLLRGHKTPES